ncbi:putative MFS transporter [Aspergillus novofumigatus IBT 16806]|uniref:Putative MFS transporter n=1 Tax=Aspergillus novofumigatus (strain IBT 16806) TaxID=1392255 RepID=A0A2I1BWS6_ASPN1|nr:putative MFS transporter [Aspergillus novofumigatus IBT 16806]PKX89820.1 putative MFS transporter [Aspergillus novofumigatus IBT 16806]
MGLWGPDASASAEEGWHSSDLESNDDVVSKVYSSDDIGQIDARRWSAAIKWISTVIISSIAALVSFAGAIDSQAASKISSEFGISEEAETLATAMFLFGFAFGALVTGPVSETFGRNAVYVTSLVVFIVCVVITGCSHSLAVQSIFRFFSIGVCWGSLSDLWTTTQQVYVFPVFSVISFVGSATGPLVGGYIAQSELSWRWVDWVTALAAGFFLATVVLFLPETFRPVLQQVKGREIQRVAGTDKHNGSSEEERKTSLAMQILLGMWRPFYLTVYEPIVVVCALYLSIIYVILFTWLNGFEYIFADTYSFSKGQVGLCFIAMFVGNCCAIPLIPVIYRIYIKALHRAQQRNESSKNEADANPESAKPPPEIHLYYAMFGAPLSLSPSSGWHCYGIWSASALSSVNFVRCLSAGGMMLASMPLYENLGVKWSLTLLGAASAVMVPVPVAFYKWGYVIRRKSKNALA